MIRAAASVDVAARFYYNYSMWTYIICDAALAVIALILFRCIFVAAWVKGGSMRDTLSERDIMLGRCYGRKRNVRRFDVVLCRYPNRKEMFVKRVIGMPGEVISIRGGMTYINGVPLREDFPHRPCARSYPPRALGADEYFVMGDNRPASSDSRNPRVGAIQRSMIRARVLCVLLPGRRKIQFEGEIKVNKRKIVAFGDSNTWGYDPSNANGICNRWPDDVRWTGVLQRELGDGFEVINEGLNGRTTVWDDPLEEYRCGKDYLPVAMMTDAPFELLIIMLGTNDLKTRFNVHPYDIAEGAGLLIQRALARPDTFVNGKPRILLVCPPRLGPISERPFGAMFGGSEEKSVQLGTYYRVVAERYGVGYLNADDFVKSSDIDALHLDPDQHEILGKKIAAKVKTMIAG